MVHRIDEHGEGAPKKVSEEWQRIGNLDSKIWLAVRGLLVIHKMVLCGLYLDTNLTVFPESERQIMRGEFKSQADFTADEAIDSGTGILAG